LWSITSRQGDKRESGAINIKYAYRPIGHYLLRSVSHHCIFELRGRWTAQGMPTHPLTASDRRIAMATKIGVFQPVLRKLKDALVLARHRMLVALASPGLIDKAAAAPVMTTLVG